MKATESDIFLFKGVFNSVISLSRFNCDTELTVDEDIPLGIVIYPITGLEREYIPIYGTRKFLLFQLEKLIEGLEGYSG